MKIFITGVTGYIGGSLAHHFLLEGHEVYGLVRDGAKAQVVSGLGIRPILGTLEDSDLIRQVASEADAVINAASSDHAGAVNALIDALRGSGKVLIHTSGSSIICDDAEGEFESASTFHDDSVVRPIALRTARVEIDRTVRRAGIDAGIRSVVICPSMVYGDGNGLQKDSDQIPKLTSISKRSGVGLFVGKGLNRWSNVHIDDLVSLYLLALKKAPSASFFFAENGEEALRHLAEGISHSLGFGGVTRSWGIQEAVAEYGDWARFAIASNSRVRARNARALLDWVPSGPPIMHVLRGGSK